MPMTTRSPRSAFRLLPTAHCPPEPSFRAVLPEPGTGFAYIQRWANAVDASDLRSIPLLQVSMHMSIGPGGSFGGPGWY
jgi:hypothetical protein